MPQTEDLQTETPQAHPWPLAGRIGFRFAFCYFTIFLFCHGNTTIFSPLDTLPWLHGTIAAWLWTPLAMLAQSIGPRMFHLTGLAAAWHGSGSGDTAMNWVLNGIFAAIALMGTLVWSVLDRRRGSYPVLYAWLRFAMRLVLGVVMIFYGFDKLFPIQMQPPTLGVLTEPFGQMSPQSLLWSMIGTFPAYEMICGSVEIVAGVLLLIRKTALAGTLLTLFVMTNVLIYNLFFDVPVKLFAAHLVLYALFLLLQDVKPLFRFLMLNKPAKPAGVWVPPASRAGILKGMRIFEVCYLVLALIAYGNLTYSAWAKLRAGQVPSPLLGSWTVQAGSDTKIKTAEGRTWTNIYFDNTFRAMVRDTSGQLWRYGVNYDPTKGTLAMSGMTDVTRFTLKVDDPNHMTITATTRNAKSKRGTVSASEPLKETLHLERQPTPKSYVLYDRGFHLVNEWGYEH
jgi:hypothetical protein